jgi:C-terminal processing protease CtpA/Prc
LAAVLRETGSGLVIGASTAGRAMIAQEFPLSNGQRLRIAMAGIKLGNGAVLSARGVKPDIEVAVGAEDEQAYLTDPFRELQASNLLAAATSSSTNNVANETNRPPRHRFTEADLVRERREGANREPALAGPGAKETEPEKPMVRDPVLARALDLIKGLAVVRRFRSP